MNILIASDGIQHRTGYGVQTELLARSLIADGHRVYNYAPGAMHGGKLDLLFDEEGRPTLTVLSSQYGDDRWGNASLGFYLDRLHLDLVITWLDAHGLGAYARSKTPTFIWAPIDTWPVPQKEMAILGRAEKVMVPSRWGQRVLRDQHLSAEYIPCGIDSGAYDIDPEAGASFRRFLPQITDETFLVGMVGLNTGSPDRKGYGYAFDVIRAFVDSHPEQDVKVYIHTNYQGDGESMDLALLRAQLGLEGVVCFSPPQGPLYAQQSFMRGMYNGFDVLLHTSLTEGFGVPVVEAQLCGTPVVVNACTSVTELAKGQYQAKPLADMWVRSITKVAIPSVPDLVLALERAYIDWKEKSSRAERARQTRQGVLKYDWAKVYDTYWRPLLADIPPPIAYADAGPEKLMLAAGQTRRDGFTHHDRLPGPGIDVAHDLNVFPWPWADESWDYIEFTDCIEHLKGDLVAVMDELHRILRPHGYVYIHTAQVGSWQLFTDPTHVRGFTLESFDYFDPERLWGKSYPYSERKWKLITATDDDRGGLIFVLQPRTALVAA